MATNADNKRDMNQQDTEETRDPTAKASHGSSRSQLDKRNEKVDMDLAEDFDSIEER